MQLRKRNRKIFGVGINDADYNVTKHVSVSGNHRVVWKCPIYGKWVNMLMRCYSDDYHKRNPTYKGCSVCDEWLIFSNFKTWMEQQDWEDKQLDKDLLKVGNRIYCPDYCVFVDRKINNFINGCDKPRSNYMIGAVSFKRDKKFKSECGNPFTGKREHLGVFDTELEAHLAWKARKHELACQLADSGYCRDDRVAQALRSRYL